jgi:hypothetical protein
LVAGANGEHTAITWGTTFPGVKGRRNIFVVCLLSITIPFNVLIQVM